MIEGAGIHGRGELHNRVAKGIISGEDGAFDRGRAAVPR